VFTPKHYIVVVWERKTFEPKNHRRFSVHGWRPTSTSREERDPPLIKCAGVPVKKRPKTTPRGERHRKEKKKVWVRGNPPAENPETLFPPKARSGHKPARKRKMEKKKKGLSNMISNGQESARKKGI